MFRQGAWFLFFGRQNPHVRKLEKHESEPKLPLRARLALYFARNRPGQLMQLILEDEKCSMAAYERLKAIAEPEKFTDFAFEIALKPPGEKFGKRAVEDVLGGKMTESRRQELAARLARGSESPVVADHAYACIVASKFPDTRKVKMIAYAAHTHITGVRNRAVAWLEAKKKEGQPKALVMEIAHALEAIPPKALAVAAKGAHRAEPVALAGEVQTQGEKLLDALLVFKEVVAKHWYHSVSEEERRAFSDINIYYRTYLPHFKKELEALGIESEIAEEAARTPLTRMMLSGATAEILVLLYLTSKYGRKAVKGGILSQTKPKADYLGRTGRPLTPDFTLETPGEYLFVEVKSRPLEQQDLLYIRDIYLHKTIETVSGKMKVTGGLVFAFSNGRLFPREFMKEDLEGIFVYTKWKFFAEMDRYRYDMDELADNMPEVRKLLRETHLESLWGLLEFRKALGPIDFIDYQMKRLELGKAPIVLGPTLNAELTKMFNIASEKQLRTIVERQASRAARDDEFLHSTIVKNGETESG